ncbi:MAG: serine/threonine-protein phosphatase [Myxococcales bacterium]|nr:serine/threonine-protein phosphatase [Myxococcales bacterium]
MSEPIEYRGQTSWETFRIHAVGHTDVGRERDVNEDSMYVDPRLDLFLVCDGMGGHASGQLASQMAVRAIVEGVAASPSKSDIDVLVRSLEAANEGIYNYADANPECRGMGTTAVAMRVDGTRLHVAHVGDSRLYRLRGPSLQQLTRDHSLSNLYADKPELEGRLGPATSNVIVRAIGLEPQVAVEHRTIAIEEYDVFLLCCDGLSDLVDDALIAGIMQTDAPLSVMATQLVDLANKNGGSDNITVILVAVLNKSGFHAEYKTTLGF